jgi:hypothetical protein
MVHVTINRGVLCSKKNHTKLALDPESEYHHAPSHLAKNNSPNHGESEQAYLLCGGTIYPSSSTMKYTVAGFSVHYTTTTTLGILGKHSNPHQIVG